MLSFILALIVASSVVEGARDSSVQIVGTSVINIPTFAEIYTHKNWPDCSGFIVAPNVVATARHCVTKTIEIQDKVPVISKFYPTKVTFYDGSNAKVLHITTDKDADLAYISIASQKHPPLPLTDKAFVGEQLFVMGAPAGNVYSYSNAYLMQGNVPTKGMGDPQYNWNGTFLLDCPSCYNGDSGAPVLNMDGEVVGVLVAVDGAPEAALIEPSSYIMQDLNETGSK